MKDHDVPYAAARPMLRRFGVVTLNLAAPGLGLLRVGRARAAAVLLSVPVLVVLASSILFRVAPVATFRWALAYVIASAILFLATFIMATRLTWQHSALEMDPKPWWSRWYCMVFAFLLTGTVANLAAAICHRFYKPFYIPTESMAPTLNLDEKFIGDMRFRGPARVADLVLIETESGLSIKRVAALGGDRIAMREGVPIVNGRAAVQRRLRRRSFETASGTVAADVLAEQLPGERGLHEVLDLGPHWVDDMPERLVPAGHIFVLGDNRDRSADSRIPIEDNGLEMVRQNQIVGRPLFIHWSQDRSRIGTSVTH